MWQFKINNSKGEVSQDLIGRIDTDVYEKGCARIEGAVPMVEGPIRNFPKPRLVSSYDLGAANNHRIFKYSLSKHNSSVEYLIMLFTENKLSILTKDLAFIRAFTTSYTDSEVKDSLSIVQVEDSVMVCCKGKEPSLIRVDEDDVMNINSYVEVDYWKNIEYPPVEPTSTKYGEDGLDKIAGDPDADPVIEGDYNLFNWWKDKSTYYFEAAFSGDMLDTDYMNSLVKGQISLYGGKFYISEVKIVSGKQRITCALLDDTEVTVPDGSGNKELVDVRAFTFSKDILAGGTNYPACVTYYHDRLIFGNIDKNASVIVSSRVGDISNFRTGTNDSDGFVVFVPGDTLQNIKELTSYKSLIVLTDGGLWSTEMNVTLTPATSQVFPQEVDIPSEHTDKYTLMNGLLFYLDKYNKRINALQYMGDSDVYNASDATIYSRHMFEDIDSLDSISWDSEEYLVAVQEDHINILTFRKEEGVMGWGRLPRYPGNSISFLSHKKDSYMFTTNNNKLEKYDFLGEEREALTLELMPPNFSREQTKNTYMDIPPFMKPTQTITRIKVALFGDYDISVNGRRKECHFSELGSQELHVIEWDNFQAGYKNNIVIEQLNNKPLKIISVAFEIDMEVE